MQGKIGTIFDLYVLVYIVVVGALFPIDARRYVILREVGYPCMVLCI